MTLRAAAFRRAFLGASVTWAAILPLTAFASSRAGVSAAVWAFSATVYAVGAAICHQRPERSFHLWSAQLPVCARCTGIYAGAAIAAVLLAALPEGFLARLTVNTADDGTRPRRGHDVIALAGAPTIATLLFEWTSGVTPGNWMRCLAGLPLGAAVVWLIVPPAGRNVNVN